jgi:fatty acid CoA ligase FadD36
MSVLLPALSGAFGDDADAVVVGDQRASREAVLSAATGVAQRIAGCEAVAVWATASMETVVAVVAGLVAGVPVVPVPPDSGPAEWGHVLRDSGASLLLVPAGLLRVLAGGEGTPPPTRMPVPVVPVELRARSSSSFAEPAPDSTALILYTSGTTGAPKGALITRRAIAADLDALAEAWSWGPEDRLVHGLPLFHVHGLVLGVLGALRTGSRLVHTGRPRPEAYAAAAGTLYFGVPTVWSRVCADRSAAQSLSAARLLVSGSAPLPAPVFEQLTVLTGQQPVERYGMTETLITVSARAAGERRCGFVGTPLAGVETRLVGEDGAAVPADGETPGELHVRGPMLFNGYLNRAEANAQAFTTDGWFRTGDIATIDAAGWHRIIGRASVDLIKSGGYRIGAGEVENALLAHPAVREAAVVGAPHPDLGQQVVAYVVAEGVTEAHLIDFVAGQISAHKRPRQVHLVEQLPRNAMGKVQKTLLASDPLPEKPGAEHRDLVLREFARQAPTFEDARLNDAFTRHLQRLVDFARPTDQDACLDVACGTGLVTRALAARARHVTALDITPEMLATGRAQADAAGLSNVVFQRGDAARLPFLDSSFSLVVTRFSLHQVAEPEPVLSELVRVCRAGGRVVVADLVARPDLPGDPDRVERLRDPSHAAMLTAETIVRLLTSAGADATAVDVFDVERPVRTWLEQSRTPTDVAAAVEAELRQELAGGAPTGMRPLVVGDELCFTQTWAHISVTAR